ncbi:MAG: glycoside hydrolase family 127 protein [Lachnospiraceae bacterium]|nr:glycoside hydrolase family 127 protein [Lachnospiraceae bacterium]
MDDRLFSKPIDLKAFSVKDGFFTPEMELVRKEVIPYQWNALNDNIPEATPSFCMRNYKLAGKITEERIRYGKARKPVEPSFPWGCFPEDRNNPEDKFYGFVFQDSDFAKWIEAVAYSLTNHPDPELEKTADEAIDIVVSAQQENGYLDTYYILSDLSKAFTNLRDHHELYCLGHLIEGAVAYYSATGKDKLLKAAEKYADYVGECFGPEEGKKKGYPGHEIIEMALVRLYEVTGKKKYLDLSKYFIDERGKKPYYFDLEDPSRVKPGDEDKERDFYHQAHRPVRNQDEAVGHAVRAVYLYSGMADVARLTGDDELLKACERLFDSIVKRKMYVTGGIGATHMGEAFSFDYDLPGDTAYAETCAAIGLVFFARRMLEIRPDSKYGDVMERALYNGVLSGMALDGKSFFYVNPLEVLPKACHRDERKFHVKSVRQKWFGCACCPPNIARLLSSVPTYAFTESSDTLFVHLYIGGTLKKRFGDTECVFNLESGFPFDGKVKVSYGSDEKTVGTLALRLPGWCKKPGYRIEGSTKKTFEKDGYLYLKGEWNKGDRIELDFDMEAVFVRSNTAVFEETGRVCLTRGPLVYCLEEADNGKDLHLLSVETGASVKVADFDALKVTGMKQLEAFGHRIVPDAEDGDLYTEYKGLNKKETSLKFVPYYAWNNRGEGEMRVFVAAED